jgi:hypothetical protein
MTPTQWSSVLAAGANAAFAAEGGTVLGSVLASMANQCRRINAIDNPREIEQPMIGTATQAMAKLPDASRGRLMPVTFHPNGEGFILDIPIGWHLVQIVPEMVSADKNKIMAVMVPDDLPLPY